MRSYFPSVGFCVSDRVRRAIAAALASGIALLGGCAAPLPIPPPSNLELPFEQAVAAATDGLAAQARRLPSPGRHPTVVDPMLDATTGEQTVATTLLERRVGEQLVAKIDGLDLLPFQTASLARAQWLLTGTMSRAFSDRPKGSMLLNLALTDLKTGTVVAQSWALVHDDKLDHSPLPFYADSPVRILDRVTEGYMTTSATAAGKPANPYYLERIAVATLINDASGSYNAGKYADALARYHTAAPGTGGDQLRVLTGIYLSNTRLGRSAEAEQAFGRIVASGIAARQLDVKFLFNPGGTAFWSDPKVSGPYTMWLRQIARESTAAKACIDVVGHTSRTGSEAVNVALSQQRAATIRQRLLGDAPALGSRIKSSGMGSRQNIVGSGTDDAVDALDRRVEFRIVPCG